MSGEYTDIPTDPELHPVARGSAGELATASLVLSAVGIPHVLERTTLLVERENLEEATRHLQEYAEENRNWPSPPDPADHWQPVGEPPTLLMIGALFLFFQVTGPWSAGSPWFTAGAVDSTAILEGGQWWRLITALTLHADGGHLLGNCLIGGFMVHQLCRTMGYGSGWLAVLLGGAAGNLLNILFRGMEHHSVGFSTSVFAAIGLFSGLQMGSGFSLRAILVPLGAGAGLLAFLGTEGERTDLGAHLWGFGCGVALGLLCVALGARKIADRPGVQRLLFALALALLAWSWLRAAATVSGPLF